MSESVKVYQKRPPKGGLFAAFFRRDIDNSGSGG